MTSDFEDKISQIQESNDIVSVVSEYISLKKTGKNYKGLCPFHNEKTPSFVVSSDKQLYHCFGCGEGGNVFTFIQKIENVSFIESAKILAIKAGIAWKDSKKDTFANELFEINNICCEYFQQKLKERKDIYNYLTEERKLTDEAINKFRLGYALSNTEDVIKFLSNKNIDLRNAEKAGILVNKDGKYYNMFRDRITFPIFDISGKIVGFSGRILNTGQPKYINTSETILFHKGNILYALNFAKKSIQEKKYAIIVEGYLDAISLHQHNITNCIASMGTSLTSSQARTLLRFTDKVIIAFDQDIAGTKATKRSIEILQQENFKIFIAELPKGKDPDSAIREIGVENFTKLLRRSKHYIQYQINNLISKKLINPEQKSYIFNRAIAILRNIKDEVVLDMYIKKVARLLNIDEKIIRGYRFFVDKPNTAGEKKAISNIFSEDKIERDILKIIFNTTDFFDYIKENIKEDDFSNKYYREIFSIFYKDGDLDLKNLHQKILSTASKPAQKIFTELATEGEMPVLDKKIIDDFITKIKIQTFRKKIKTIKEEIILAEKNKDLERCKILAEEYMHLEQEKRKLMDLYKKLKN